MNETLRYDRIELSDEHRLFLENHGDLGWTWELLHLPNRDSSGHSAQGRTLTFRGAHRGEPGYLPTHDEALADGLAAAADRGIYAPQPETSR